jgi:hypothetical protein
MIDREVRGSLWSRIDLRSLKRFIDLCQTTNFVFRALPVLLNEEDSNLQNPAVGVESFSSGYSLTTSQPHSLDPDMTIQKAFDALPQTANSI